jgi:hypothetical protein
VSVSLWVCPILAYEAVEYELWSATKPDEHVLYSLADVDDRYVESIHLYAVLANFCSAREAPEDEFEGYLSMIIMELNISTLRQQNMLMCNEWFVMDGLSVRRLSS